MHKILLLWFYFFTIIITAPASQHNLLSPFTILGKCDVPTDNGALPISQTGGLNSASWMRCDTSRRSPISSDIETAARSTMRRKLCCVKTHGSRECITLRTWNTARVSICGDPGWCHPCQQVAALAEDIANMCGWMNEGELRSEGTWYVGGRFATRRVVVSHS